MRTFCQYFDFIQKGCRGPSENFFSEKHLNRPEKKQKHFPEKEQNLLSFKVLGIPVETPGSGDLGHTCRMFLGRQEPTSKWPEHPKNWSKTPFLCYNFGQATSKWPKAMSNSKIWGAEIPRSWCFYRYAAPVHLFQYATIHLREASASLKYPWLVTGVFFHIAVTITYNQ